MESATTDQTGSRQWQSWTVVVRCGNLPSRRGTFKLHWTDRAQPMNQSKEKEPKKNGRGRATRKSTCSRHHGGFGHWQSRAIKMRPRTRKIRKAFTQVGDLLGSQETLEDLGSGRSGRPCAVRAWNTRASLLIFEGVRTRLKGLAENLRIIPRYIALGSQLEHHPLEA